MGFAMSVDGIKCLQRFRLHFAATFLVLIQGCNATVPQESLRTKQTTEPHSGDTKPCLKIIGATESDSYPAAFLTVSPIPGQTNQYYLCTATAVSHNLAVTAAHCLRDPELTDPKIFRLNTRKLTYTNMRDELKYGVQAKRVFRHTGIYGGSHDLDNLTTDYALKDVAYIEFPVGSFTQMMAIHTGAKPNPGESATIVGFGQHSLQNPDIIKDGGMYQQNAVHTLAAFPANLDPKYIAGLIYLGSDKFMPFHGDSGGPLLYQSKVAGVLSIGDPALKMAYYASLTSVDSLALLKSVKDAGLTLGEPYVKPVVSDPNLPLPTNQVSEMPQSPTSDDCK